jgi:hypothetical protein
MTGPDDDDDDRCMCDFDDECDGEGTLRCIGCGGDLCVCLCGGDASCDGCEACEPGFITPDEEE